MDNFCGEKLFSYGDIRPIEKIYRIDIKLEERLEKLFRDGDNRYNLTFSRIFNLNESIFKLGQWCGENNIQHIFIGLSAHNTGQLIFLIGDYQDHDQTLLKKIEMCLQNIGFIIKKDKESEGLK